MRDSRNYVSVSDEQEPFFRRGKVHNAVALVLMILIGYLVAARLPHTGKPVALGVALVSIFGIGALYNLVRLLAPASGVGLTPQGIVQRGVCSDTLYRWDNIEKIVEAEHTQVHFSDGAFSIFRRASLKLTLHAVQKRVVYVDISFVRQQSELLAAVHARMLRRTQAVLIAEQSQWQVRAKKDDGTEVAWDFSNRKDAQRMIADARKRGKTYELFGPTKRSPGTFRRITE